MGSIVNQIVIGPQADPLEMQSGCIGALPTREVVDMVVRRAVIAGSQRLGIPALETDSRRADVVQVAGIDATGLPAGDRDATAPRVADRAAGDLDPLRVLDLDGIATHMLNGPAPRTAGRCSQAPGSAAKLAWTGALARSAPFGGQK